jgi:hypothetical protein
MKPHGMDCPRHKLTDDNVRTMRALADSHSLSVLARMFGVSKAHAHRVVRGHKWAHIIDRDVTPYRLDSEMPGPRVVPGACG